MSLHLSRIFRVLVVAAGIAFSASAQKPYQTQKGTEILWDKWGVPHVYAKSVPDMFYCFGWAHRTLAILSFRGTDALAPADLLTDIKFHLIPWPRGGHVHLGFAEGLATVRPAIDTAIASLTCRLLITGHSLGAGLATLLASDLVATRPDTEIFTFGSPRCGDAAFAATVPIALSHRYVDCCDAITRIPLGLMDYQHIGDPFYIDRHGAITPNPSAGLIESDRLAAVASYLKRYLGHPGAVPTRDLADHTCLNYVSAVAELRS